MNRVIIYTSNIGFEPKNLEQVISFAKGKPKFYITEVALNSYLSDVQVGDNLRTDKGNSLYVLKTFDRPVDQLNAEDAAYVDNLTRNYNLKKSNISSVKNRIKFETWCPYAKPLLAKNQKTNQPEMKNSFKNFGERLKAQFYPEKAEDVRIAMDGNICVETNDGFVAIDNDFNLISYPVEAVLPVPAYTIARPFDQLKPGDVICRAKSYAKVKEIKGGKICVVGFTGTGSCVYPIKDFLLGQATVRVVVSYTGLVDGQINPMMLIALSEDKKGSSMLPLLMMSQNGGNIAQNPMMLALLAGDGEEDFSIKDMLMYSMLGGNQNPFANLFGAAAPVKKENPAVKEDPENDD